MDLLTGAQGEFRRGMPAPSNCGLRIVEAVADGVSAERPFLPDRHANVLLGERGSGLGEINDIAGCVGAKPIRARFESTKGVFSQERFDGKFFDGLSLRLTGTATRWIPKR